MNKFLKAIIIFLIAINLFFCAWYVIHKDIYFFTDIARDFLLLQEVDQKHVVFVGPRSSTSGLFHGPLWLYVNYPAYKIGQGDPIIVGWYWIVLIAAFLIMSFFIAKQLFDETTAYLYVVLLSGFLITESRALYNPHGALFVMPLAFFLFVRYFQTLKFKYLALFFFGAGCIIQFHIGVGIPFLILSIPPILYLILKHKKIKHLLTFTVLLIPLSTFIIFDLRHHFLMLHSALNYAFASKLDTHYYSNDFSIISDRLNYAFLHGPGIFRDGSGYKDLFACAAIIFFLFFQLRHRKYKIVYLSFLYFYLGYFALSVINKSGGMLYQYYMPFFSLTFLVFASFITSKFSKAFILVLIYVLIVNATFANTFIHGSDSFIGKNLESWKFLSNLARKVYSGQEKEFGYFVYSPDTVGYQPKYAMVYAGMHSSKRADSFQKRPITYIVITPPPPDKPWIKDEWWKENQLKLMKKPESVVSFPNGYRTEKYLLSEKDMRIPFDPAIDTGIHFR